MTSWQVVAVLAVLAVILAIVTAVLIRASRADDPGRVSGGWLSEARRRDDAREDRS